MPDENIFPYDETVLEALRKFVRDEPKAAARLLAVRASGLKISLVIHEHRAAKGDGFDPGERKEWSKSIARSCGVPSVETYFDGHSRGCDFHAFRAVNPYPVVETVNPQGWREGQSCEQENRLPVFLRCIGPDGENRHCENARRWCRFQRRR